MADECARTISSNVETLSYDTSLFVPASILLPGQPSGHMKGSLVSVSRTLYTQHRH